MNKTTLIEYENLKNSNEIYFPEMEQAIKKVLMSGRYILGEEVERFEDEFAKYVGGKYCIGVGNGLDALTLAIRALDLPINSDILVPSNTYIATIIAIINSGHKPILVEPDLNTFNINPRNIEQCITSKTHAICITHLFGKSCEMSSILQIVQNYGLKLIEDCAQSHGAKFANLQTGTFGDAGCFSFYPTKNLGAIGDGGAVVTNSEEVAEKLQYLRNYGSKIKYHNKYIGVNSRLDEMQAAVLRIKLRHLNEAITYKRKLANIYFNNLPEWLIKPSISPLEFDVFHIYGVRSENRDHLKKTLLEFGVGSEIHYPIPPHRQEGLSGYFAGSYPVSDELHSTELSLPISLGHTESQIKSVCKILSSKEFEQIFFSQ